MKRRMWLVLLALPALCFFVALALSAAPAVLDARELDQLEIYAYRDWQGTSVQVEQGQPFTINARGAWLYTPGEWNGPDGHSRYRAPEFYPVPAVGGGALIGRIGEQGRIFYVGSNWTGLADGTGQIYLRIDDDILSDNEGQLQVQIKTEEPTPSPQPVRSGGQSP